ncbi:MAG TPA: hypothetical protein VFQ67_05240 [Allosphingosinicella sp.]|jgi:hypothetical protein|nr:hypothetical protein [Allosphingosinicella sp.]
MQAYAIAAAASLAALWAVPADAAEISAEAAIARYCEPLAAGSSAGQVEALARKDGLEADTVAGQRVMRRGDLLVGLSDSPRVCFVQAPARMTRTEGFAVVDAWAKRQAGAARLAATAGPDGAPVRGWAVPARKIALIATEQTSPAGPKVMNFILMPLPGGPATP